MSLLSIIDFAKYDPDPINNVSMCANKHVNLSYYHQTQNDGASRFDLDSCLIVTATAGTTSTPGVIFKNFRSYYRSNLLLYSCWMELRY